MSVSGKILENLGFKLSSHPLLNEHFDDGDSTLTLYCVYHYRSVDEYGSGYYQDWLDHKEDKTMLYCMLNNRGKKVNFVFNLHKSDKKYAKNWKVKDWVRVLCYIGHKTYLEQSLGTTKEDIRELKMFSDLRKVAMIKKRELTTPLREADRNLEETIKQANYRVIEDNLFTA